MAYDPNLQVIRVYNKLMDSSWAGSIQIPEEVKRKVNRYMDRFDTFKQQMKQFETDEIIDKFQSFMKKLFKKLEKDIIVENQHKEMAQTMKIAKMTPEEPEKIQVKNIMTQIYGKLTRLIAKEKKKISNDEYDPDNLMAEKEFKNLKENTLKIIKLLDISDFKNRPGYTKVKKLLVQYMMGDTAEKPRLKKRNCLIVFKKLLLKELELKG